MMNRYRPRNASTKDIKELEWLIHEDGNKIPNFNDSKIQKFVVGNTRLLVTNKGNDEKIVGGVFSYILDESKLPSSEFESRLKDNKWSKGGLYIDSLAVNEDYRGQGIAPRLLALTARKARRAGSLIVTLDVERPGAYRVYFRDGFVPITRLGNDVHMKKIDDPSLLHSKQEIYSSLESKGSDVYSVSETHRSDIKRISGNFDFSTMPKIGYKAGFELVGGDLRTAKTVLIAQDYMVANPLHKACATLDIAVATPFDPYSMEAVAAALRQNHQVRIIVAGNKGLGEETAHAAANSSGAAPLVPSGVSETWAEMLAKNGASVVGGLVAVSEAKAIAKLQQHTRQATKDRTQSQEADRSQKPRGRGGR
jgi:GNAT superfamily N-acetyltransferase